MTTKSNKNLSEFLDDVCESSHLRVEADLGSGFVKLRSEEAERRQAAQDIRCVEDGVIEMLRNSRDARAKNIFIATSKHESAAAEKSSKESATASENRNNGENTNKRDGAGVGANSAEFIREIVVIDDGCGVPENLTSAIFDARVTSKLDTFHEDKWGVHGRGMALFSISQNAECARVVKSAPEAGTSIYAKFNLSKLPEKRDQSTPPAFVRGEDSKVLVRGPHNILRTATEFAIEHRSALSVYIGSPAEVAAALYFCGCCATSSASRLFSANLDDITLTKHLAYMHTPETFAQTANTLGLNISERAARRILNDEIKAPEPLWDIVHRALTSQNGEYTYAASALPENKENSSNVQKEKQKQAPSATRDAAQSPTQNATPQNVHISKEDLRFMAAQAAHAYSQVADAYYLNSDVEVRAIVSNGHLRINIPLVE